MGDTTRCGDVQHIHGCRLQPLELKAGSKFIKKMCAKKWDTSLGYTNTPG